MNPVSTSWADNRTSTSALIHIKFEDSSLCVGRVRTVEPTSVFVSLDNNCLQPMSTITIKAILHNGRHSTVFRGTATIGGRPVDLAVKFARIQELTKEERVYSGPCKSLQGRVIPRFYGIYRLRGQEEISCTVMEYSGTALARSFTTYSRHEQSKILHALLEVHQTGICPTDFAERNVLAQNGEYRLIDFHDYVEHTCKWRYDFLHGTDGDFDAMSKEDELGCPSLYDIADEVMGFWDHGRVVIKGVIFRGSDLPSQEVIYELPPPDRHIIRCRKLDKLRWILTYYRIIQSCIVAGETIDSLRPRLEEIFCKAQKQPFTGWPETR